jgi:hypothetical protein
MNRLMIKHESEKKNNKVITSKTKKIAPISLITHSNILFKKGKLNNVATSYLESCQKIQNPQNRTIEATHKSKSKNSKIKNSSHIYNTFNKTFGSSYQKKNKKINKIKNNNKKKDMINSFNLSSNIDSNFYNTTNKKNVSYNKDGIDSYNHINSITKKNLSKDFNKVNSNNDTGNLKQMKINIKRTLSILINGDGDNNFSHFSIGKNINNNINVKKNILVKKNITFFKHQLNKSMLKRDISINKTINKISFDSENVNKKNNNNEKSSNNIKIKPKKMFKQYFVKKTIEMNTNLKSNLKNKLKNSATNKFNNYSLKNKNNKYKNSVNKSTTISTSRTNLSIEKEDKKTEEGSLNNKIFINNNKKNINMFSLINDNSKKIKNKSNEKLKGNFSFEIEENSSDNIVNVLNTNPELLNEEKFIEYDDFNDLNSIIRKINYDNLQKDSESIFSINNNLKYNLFFTKFNNDINNINKSNKISVSNKLIKINNCLTTRNNTSKKKYIKAILKGK